MSSFTQARRNMVENQLRAGGVREPALLEVMGRIPRDMFVTDAARPCAYAETEVEQGTDSAAGTTAASGPADARAPSGRILMTPRVFALLAQGARIDPGCVVLDVGCGSGYSTAVLARLADTVVATESDPALAATAAANLAALGADNAAVVETALAEGCPEQGPYDVIFLNGAVGQVPPALLAQLTPGGRLAAVAAPERKGAGCIHEKTPQGTARRELFAATAPMLPGFEIRPVFAF